MSVFNCISLNFFNFFWIFWSKYFIQNFKCIFSTHPYYPNSSNSSTYVRCSKDNADYGLTLVDAYSMATGIRKQSGSDRKNGVKIESDSVATPCGCPCALLILGNWDSSKERKRLQEEEFMDLMCEGIYDGLVTVVSGAPPTSPVTEISDDTVPEPQEVETTPET